MKTASTEKPDVSQRVSIRISRVAKQRLLEICRAEHLDEALVVRIILEAGLNLCEETGLEGVLRSRREFLGSTTSKSRSPRKKTPQD